MAFVVLAWLGRHLILDVGQVDEFRVLEGVRGQEDDHDGEGRGRGEVVVANLAKGLRLHLKEEEGDGEQRAEHELHHRAIHQQHETDEDELAHLPYLGG